jgi:Putative Tad-like Flp pilus-assembly
MKRFRAMAQRQGVILPLAALLMVFVAGVTAFAIDCGTITLARTQLQAAADAAAISAADALSTSTTAATTAATTIAQANYAGGTHVSVVAASDVEFGDWDTTTSTFTLLTGSAASSANAVRVTCRMSQARGTALTLFFAPIYGKSTTDVSAQAIAVKAASACGFVGLNSIDISGGSFTDSYDSSSAYSAGSATAKGNVCSNGNISLSGGLTKVNGNSTAGAGYSTSESGGATVTGTTTAATQSLSEAAIDSSAASTTNNDINIPLDNKGKTVYTSGTHAFSISGGDTVTLPAGTYYFSSVTVSGGSIITFGSGQTTIYCTGDWNTSGGSLVNPAQVPSDLKINVQGSTTVLSGSAQMCGEVYAPASDITRSGGSSAFFGSMVGKSLTLSGGGGLHYDTSMGGSNATAELVK